MNLVDKITKSQIRTDLPEFRVGDTIQVGYHIKEGNKERIQQFEGIVMTIKGSGISKNFIVRKQSAGIGVEKTYALNKSAYLSFRPIHWVTAAYPLPIPCPPYSFFFIKIEFFGEIAFRNSKPFL